MRIFNIVFSNFVGILLASQVLFDNFSAPCYPFIIDYAQNCFYLFGIRL